MFSHLPAGRQAHSVKSTKKAPTFLLKLLKYPGPGSNRHGRNVHRILSPACLPIPPPGQTTGAFHVSKPSDLIPELQGRFPIRVELDPLTKEDFISILTEPQNALIKQYEELLKTENIELVFKEDAISEIADTAQNANDSMENIGARRLHTILERLLDEISFNAPDISGKRIVIDATYVTEKMEDIIKDRDLSRYIL